MSETDKPDTRQARTLAVTSGKGGVGKTFVSANLGAALARQGLKVLVLDADLGLANLDVALNLPPHVTLHEVLSGKSTLDEAILPGPMGMYVLLAGSGMVEYSRLTPHVRDELVRVFDELLPRFDNAFLQAAINLGAQTIPHGVTHLNHAANPGTGFGRKIIQRTQDVFLTDADDSLVETECVWFDVIRGGNGLLLGRFHHFDPLRATNTSRTL